MFGLSAAKRKLAKANAARQIKGRASPSEDPQRETVYRFESAWAAWNTNNLTLQECRDAIRWACLLFDVPSPRVKQHNTEAMSECDVSLGIISMQARARRPGRGGKNAATALHEAAHWIVFQQHEDRPQDHGPTFLGVYLRLLTAYGVAPAAALLPAARHYGLRWT